MFKNKDFHFLQSCLWLAYLSGFKPIEKQVCWRAGYQDILRPRFFRPSFCRWLFPWFWHMHGDIFGDKVPCLPTSVPMEVFSSAPSRPWIHLRPLSLDQFSSQDSWSAAVSLVGIEVLQSLLHCINEICGTDRKRDAGSGRQFWWLLQLTEATILLHYKQLQNCKILMACSRKHLFLSSRQGLAG